MIDDQISELLEFLYLTPVGVVKFRQNGAIRMANPMATQLLMPLAPDADMTNLYRALSNVLPDLRERVARFHAPCGQLCDQLQLSAPGTGTVLTLTVHKIDPDTLMGVIQDISLAIEQETRLRDDQRRVWAIFENVRDYAIYTVDLGGRVDGWNRSLERIGGWREADVVGRPISMFFPEDDRALTTDLLSRARSAGTAELEGWRIRRDGSRFWGNTVATATPDADGQVCGYVLVTRDLTARKRMEDRLVALSITDPLTTAFNRRAGETMLADAYGLWRREGRVFSVLMVDCDHFKRVNDRWGHDAGDKVLVRLVQTCREKLRDLDTTFRWGGEEFLVLVPGANSVVSVTIAERLREAVAALVIEAPSDSITITVSIGVAEVAASDEGSPDTVRRADRAVYQAKANGRNRVVAD